MTAHLIQRLRGLAERATQGPLKLDRYDHGGGRLYRECPRTLVADFFDEGDREFYAALSPALVLRMLEVAEAASAVQRTGCVYGPFQESDLERAFEKLDKALAGLDGEVA